jgi:CelD/BcsL family acetyltransferase involved in cellulose biosynthesis
VSILAGHPPDGVTASLDRLVELQQDDPAWLDLVAAAPEATVFHLPSWTRVVADTYGFPATVLAQRDERGGVAAGVPLMRVRRLSGPAWVSLPFSDHCPPLARDLASLGRLAAGLAGWTARHGVPVEVRGGLPSRHGWRDAAVGVRHVMALDEGAEALRARLSETHRRRLRQAERSGLRVRCSRSADDMAAFYRLHLLTRRRQGVPVQPRRFFRALWQRVVAPGQGVVLLVETPAGQAVAGAVVLSWNGTATGKFQASDATSWELRPNHACYWAALRWASETGHRRFDFGRSETHHAGLQRWKAGWGAEAVPLSYALTGGGSPSVGDRGLLAGALRQVIRRSPALVCEALGTLLYRFAA